MKQVGDFIIGQEERILVTGAGGFIGSKVAEVLVHYGFRDVRCLVRPSSERRTLTAFLSSEPKARGVEVVEGNLLSRDDCLRVTEGVAVIYHLAAGTGTKSFSDAFLNSVVTTRNLIEAALHWKTMKRFVNLSSFAVYTNRNKPQRQILDESCPVEARPESRAEAYCYAKVKQDELVVSYGTDQRLPFVLLRPGVVYGPGKKAITGRVGIDSFGFFLHLGGANEIPLTYVDNCAEAVVLAGLKPGVEGEVFNIVDDDLPSSWEFLRQYKQKVRRFRSIYLPHGLSYLFCYLWEWYSTWSERQLPPALSTREWSANWKKTSYSNKKLKRLLGWSPKIATAKGLEMYFASCREYETSA